MDARVGLKLPKDTDHPIRPAGRRAGEWGSRAEKLGFDTLWTSEGWETDAFVQLAEIASATTSIRLGTAIVNVFSRSPATLAMAGTGLQRLSGGRFILGLGVSTPERIESLHDRAYERPIRTTHEVAAVTKRLAGDGDEPVTYEGETLSVDGYRPLNAPFPMYNAALGPANRRATGRVFDGWLPYWVPFSQLEAAYDTVVAAAEAARREPAEIAVSPQVLALVDEDVEAARDVVREYAVAYIGRSDAYKNAAATAFPEEVERIRDAFEAGDEAGAARAVTGEMIDEFALVGPAADVRDRFYAIAERSIVDEPILYVPYSVDLETTDRTIEALAPTPD